MASGTTKPRKRQFVRSPAEKELKLTQRDIEVLVSLAAYRLLTSAQLTALHWPPSPFHQLIKQGLGKDQARDLLQRFASPYIQAKLDVLKWLQRVAKVKAGQQTTSAQRTLTEWLRALATADEPAVVELDQALNSLAAMIPADWLVTAIEQDLAPPTAFAHRPDAHQQHISRACTHRMRLLYDAGYVEKIEQPTRLQQGRAPTVYLLSKKGCDDLAKLLQKKPQEVCRRELANISNTALPHFIKTNDIRIAITLDAQAQGFEIIEWRDDLSLRRFHQRPSERVTVEFRGKDVTFGVVPDGYFWLYANERGHSHFWIECDLDTVVARYAQDGAKDFQRKVMGIGEYYRTRYSEAYPEAKKSLRILVVTTNQTRLNRLRAVIQQAAGSGAHRYFLTTFELLLPASPLTDRIWTRADREGLFSLV